jgi:hypothetical protein
MIHLRKHREGRKLLAEIRICPVDDDSNLGCLHSFLRTADEVGGCNMKLLLAEGDGWLGRDGEGGGEGGVAR